MASQPLIPTPVWASVFNYLPHKDLRSSLLISRRFAKELPSNIDTLNIFDHNEMDVPYTRKFSNITSVNLLCVLRVQHLDSFPRAFVYIVVEEATRKIVPFLQAFSKLKFALLGGWRYDDFTGVGRKRRHFSTRGPLTMINSDTRFIDLIKNLSTAFKMRALSQTLKLDIFHANICNRNNRECKLCQEVASSFPFKDAFFVAHSCKHKGRLCLKLLGNRAGGREFIKDPKRLDEIFDLPSHLVPSRHLSQDALKTFMNTYRLTRDKALCFYILKCSVKELKFMKCLVSYGIDASAFHFKRSWANFAFLKPFFGITKSTYASLKELGFQIPTDFLLVDDGDLPEVFGGASAVDVDGAFRNPFATSRRDMVISSDSSSDESF